MATTWHKIKIYPFIYLALRQGLTVLSIYLLSFEIGPYYLIQAHFDPEVILSQGVPPHPAWNHLKLKWFILAFLHYLCTLSPLHVLLHCSPFIPEQRRDFCLCADLWVASRREAQVFVCSQNLELWTIQLSLALCQQTTQTYRFPQNLSYLSFS